MGLLGLTATVVCSRVGADNNVITLFIQRNGPGFGPSNFVSFPSTCSWPISPNEMPHLAS
jgi:hypothetical protein